MNNSSPRVALFYDWLNQWGGAERVLLDILKIFPNSPIYTLIHDPSKTSWLPKNTKVVTSFLQKLPGSLSNPICYTPLYPLAIEQFNFTHYDIVISSTTTIGHCLLTPPKTLFVCYFHNINRRIYPGRFPLTLYQKIDRIYSHRPDQILASSQNIQSRIKKFYNFNSYLIYPGIDTAKFVPNNTNYYPLNTNYYLIVSRLVPHKHIEIAIEACIKLQIKLIIVGTGRQQKSLINKHLQHSNIKFLGAVTESKLIKLYQNCLALICPQKEDFGLTPLEAMACGRPVIAYGSGGFTETILPQKTGLFFKQQTAESLAFCLSSFQPSNFSPADCRNQALKFSQDQFMLNFKKFILTSWKQKTFLP